MLIKTQYNRELHPCNYEINEEPSSTIPDQTLSIRTILERYTRGQSVDGMKTPIYQQGEDYSDLPDPKTLDLSERQEIAQLYRSELNELKKNILKKPPEVQDGETSATLPEKGADGTEAQKNSHEMA
ncbi:MAG: hypothetical protein [Microvirus sp.]|nr:MAG: hypothetical protein [Microvirus sp.]